jgi:hypothetical protein
VSEVSRAARTSAAFATGSERSTRQLYDVRLGFVKLRGGVPANSEEEAGASANPPGVDERHMAGLTKKHQTCRPKRPEAHRAWVRR